MCSLFSYFFLNFYYRGNTKPFLSEYIMSLENPSTPLPSHFSTLVLTQLLCFLFIFDVPSLQSQGHGNKRKCDGFYSETDLVCFMFSLSVYLGDH